MQPLTARAIPPDSGGIAYGMDELHAGSTGIDTDTAASNSA